MLLSRNRSRSTSPRHCFHRAGLYDRVDLIASSDHNMFPRTRNYTSKFFASGNCSSTFLNSHTDQTDNSFNNYKLDDCRQGIYSRVNIAPGKEGSEGSGATLDFHVQVPNWDKSEGIGEQRGLRSSADDYAVNSNRFMAHSSSGMSVSDPRGTMVLGANIEGPMTFTGSQLLTLDGTSREPGVLNIVRSEASSSSVQCSWSREQISSLTDIFIWIVEGIKLRPELFEALSGTNALVILQSFVAGFAGPDAPAPSSRQLNLVIESLKLIEEKQAELASSSKLPHGADSGGVGLYRTACRNVELNVYRLPSGKKDQFADCYNKEPNLSMGGEIKERNDERELVSNEVDDKDCQRMETTDGDSLCDFKHALADFVKELLTPSYIRDQIDRDTYKKIVSKVVKKVILSVQSIPQTQVNIEKYLSTFRPNISKLVKVCADPLKLTKFHSFFSIQI